MADFSTLLSKPAGQAKRPPALDVGDYPGVIKGYEMGDQNRNKTPYVRFNLGLVGWPDGATPQTKEDGAEIDLSAKSLRRDFYLSDDAIWRLDEMLRNLGITMTGTETYLDVLPQTVGASVLVEVRQYMNQQTNDIGNEVQGLKALS